MLEIRIRQLEAEVKDEDTEINDLKSTNSTSAKTSPVPRHLHSVQPEYLALLRGYRMLYKATPNGACAQVATAVHVHETEE